MQSKIYTLHTKLLFALPLSTNPHIHSSTYPHTPIYQLIFAFTVIMQYYSMYDQIFRDENTLWCVMP